MPFELWLVFVAATVILLVIPGPTILTVVSYSMLHGGRATVPLVTGVALGDSAALALSLAGLGALLSLSAFWFNALKWVGGLYLLYLGITMFRAGISISSPKASDLPGSHWKGFLNTFVVTALNPKSILFFVAFLPQFVAPGLNVVHQLWILAVTFVVLATIGATGYAVFAGAASRLLQSPEMQRRFSFGGGSLLTLAGIWVLLSRRPVAI